MGPNSSQWRSGEPCKHLHIWLGLLHSCTLTARLRPRCHPQDLASHHPPHQRSYIPVAVNPQTSATIVCLLSLGVKCSFCINHCIWSSPTQKTCIPTGPKACWRWWWHPTIYAFETDIMSKSFKMDQNLYKVFINRCEMNVRIIQNTSKLYEKCYLYPGAILWKKYQ